MHSPLPDSSALEAGIIEDDRPTRLSRVQDNVRNLLRNSVFGSVVSSPSTPTRPQHQMNHGLPTPLASPVRPIIENDNSQQVYALPTPVPTPIRLPPVLRQAFPEILRSPASATEHVTSSTSLESVNVAEFPRPSESSHGRIQRIAHQSGMFNARAVEALNHPDLSEPSMEELSQQKAEYRQRRSWKRSRRSRKAAQKAAASRSLLCLFSSLLLAALVATYVSIATTSSGLTTTFHVLFVLGICLATVVFAHSVVRLSFMRRRLHDQPLFVAVSRHGHQHRPRNRHHPYQQRSQRQMPTLSDEPTSFMPPTPIPVHLSSDDVRADPHVAQPSAGAQAGGQEWDKEVTDLPNPPPAYGRWRGSVKADPELLHWQAIPSPVSPHTPTLPSPTYEETMATAHNESPPSYVTRDSPARQREIQEARTGIAQSQVIAPEMVEVRAVGVGFAM